MKRLIYIFIGILLPIISQGQRIPDGKSVTGTVVDSAIDKPLSLATVALLNLDKDSSVVVARVTNNTGKFTLTALDGRYILKVSLLGYLVDTRIITLDDSKNVNNLIIPLQKSLILMKEVNIVGTKKAIELIPGGYKFNVAKGALGATSSIFEILRQVPGVTVDGANNVKLQGKSVTVMVDGRKVNMTGNDLAVYLRSLQANQVADIDVNTNPTAKFDADGEGGILNLKLKRAAPGLFGNLSTNISTLVSTDNSGSVNYKKNKWDLSGSYNYTYRKDIYQRTTYYENKSLPDSLYIFRQNRISRQYQQGQSFKAGIAYDIDSTSTIGANFFGAIFKSNSPWEIESKIYNRSDIYQGKYIQKEMDLVNNNFYIYDLIYKKSFQNKDQLNVGFNFSKYGNKSNEQYNRTFYDVSGAPIADQYESDMIIQTIRPYDITASNADYTHNLSKNSKLDFGVKYTTATTSSAFINSALDTTSQTYVRVASLDNDLHYSEHVLAGYGLFSGKLSKLNYQAGVRYEDFGYTLNSPSISGEYKNSYKNFFPSLYVSYNSKDYRSNFSFNYGRRIQRPGYAMLNPFLNVETLGQYTVGNPYLKPYFIDKIELQFTRSYGDGNFFMASIFGSRATNIFSPIFKFDPEAQMNVDTYENLRNNKQYGGYLVIQNKLSSWFNFNAYLAGNTSTFSSNLPGDILLPGLFSFTGNLSLNFTVLDKTQIQLYGYIVTKNNNFQVQNATSGNISMSAQRKFLNNRLTASLTVEDIFNINQFPVSVYNPNVYLTSLNKYKSQYLRLGFQYTFGKEFNSKSKKELQKNSRIDTGN